MLLLLLLPLLPLPLPATAFAAASVLLCFAIRTTSISINTGTVCREKRADIQPRSYAPILQSWGCKIGTQACQKQLAPLGPLAPLGGGEVKPILLILCNPLCHLNHFGDQDCKNLGPKQRPSFPGTSTSSYATDAAVTPLLTVIMATCSGNWETCKLSTTVTTSGSHHDCSDVMSDDRNEGFPAEIDGMVSSYDGGSHHYFLCWWLCDRSSGVSIPACLFKLNTDRTPHRTPQLAPCSGLVIEIEALCPPGLRSL